MVWVGVCVSLEWSHTVAVGYGKCRCGWMFVIIITDGDKIIFFKYCCHRWIKYCCHGWITPKMWVGVWVSLDTCRCRYASVVFVTYFTFCLFVALCARCENVFLCT